jgi:hypothetical protein
MQDILQSCMDKGYPVIDETKDEAYYRNQRLQNDLEGIAKHQFVQNVEYGPTSLEPETYAVKKRISFDLVMFWQQSGLYENGTELNELMKKLLSEQLLEMVSINKMYT